jgi:hypothetical protein
VCRGRVRGDENQNEEGRRGVGIGPCATRVLSVGETVPEPNWRRKWWGWLYLVDALRIGGGCGMIRMHGNKKGMTRNADTGKSIQMRGE